jgi:hypothetical protein
MAELSALQNVGILAGFAGFGISLANAIQTWRKNRPVMSVHPGAHPADKDIEITIENPSALSITITGTLCRPGAHELHPEKADLHHTARAAVDGGVNWIISPRQTARFNLHQAAGDPASSDGSFLFFVFWHSNAAFLFSRIPVFVVVTKRRRYRLRHAGGASADD